MTILARRPLAKLLKRMNLWRTFLVGHRLAAGPWDFMGSVGLISTGGVESDDRSRRWTKQGPERQKKRKKAEAWGGLLATGCLTAG